MTRITFDLGNKLWELGDHVTAAQTHRESLTMNTAYSKVLSRYEEAQEWSEFMAFIDTLNERRDVWDAYFDELDSDMLSFAADTTGRWDIIERFFLIAIDIGSKQKAYDLLFLLREEFARTLELTRGTVDEKTVIDTRVAALESLKAHPSNTLPQARIYAMTDLLAQIYLGKAFQPNIPRRKSRH
ncbi:hypothetical protein RRF57_001764 [Xylaria bambusicola]|uniref:Uncharacterized protein n=1 Tax=Xylaria bambusicola TaxID=326684 RepID=A0AAN7UC13_9PEZI